MSLTYTNIGNIVKTMLPIVEREAQDVPLCDRYQTCREKVIDRLVNQFGAEKWSVDFSVRRIMTAYFSWAIPNHTAISLIKQHSPNGVVEIGCGSGYWAHLLSNVGVDVVAYDINPGKEYGGYEEGNFKTWIDDIRQGDSSAVKGHGDKTLFLCWPCYDEQWSLDTARQYLKEGGQTIIYIGEGGGGCTGCDKLHNLLFRGLEVSGSVYIPTWDGIHDSLYVLTKPSKGGVQ